MARKTKSPALIKKAWQKNGLDTPLNVSNKCNISRQTIYNWLKNKDYCLYTKEIVKVIDIDDKGIETYEELSFAEVMKWREVADCYEIWNEMNDIETNHIIGRISDSEFKEKVKELVMAICTTKEIGMVELAIDCGRPVKEVFHISFNKFYEMEATTNE